MEPEKFYQSSRQSLILDVRSPAEYADGHIPGAVSFPLFSNNERHEVGLCYKKKGRDKAVELGLEFVGPKLAGFSKRARKLSKGNPINLYCWRGGMRSNSMATLFQAAGMKTKVLKGGYKAYRTWIHERFENSQQFITIGGMTGSGKTEILWELEKLGEQVLDLEGLASHRGSAFGKLDGEPQPSSEQFQNMLFDKLMSFDANKVTWVEDESQHVGKVWINDPIFKAIKKAPLVIIERTLDERVEKLINMYGDSSVDDLALIFEKISKRLGGDRVKMAIQSIREGDGVDAVKIVLHYYDKTYKHSLEKYNRVKNTVHNAEGKSYTDIAGDLIKYKQAFYAS